MASIFLLQLLKSYLATILSYVLCLAMADSLGSPWTVPRQPPLSMGFRRQEYWSGVPRPPAGDLSDPGIESTSLTSPALAGGFFTTHAT